MASVLIKQDHNFATVVPADVLAPLTFVIQIVCFLVHFRGFRISTHLLQNKNGGDKNSGLKVQFRRWKFVNFDMFSGSAIDGVSLLV